MSTKNYRVLLLLLFLLVSYPLQVSSRILGDLDNDGQVAFSDFLIFAGNFGRKDEGENFVNVNQLNDRGFPLAVGNVWNYEGLDISFSPEGKDIFHWKTEYRVEAKERIGDFDAFRVRVTITGHHNFADTDTSYAWYINTSGTLEEVGREGSGTAWKPSEDDLYSSLRLFLPLRNEKKWDSSGRTPFAEQREVSGKEILDVPAGTFEVYQIRETLSIAEDVTIVSWFGSIGLIKHAFVTGTTGTHYVASIMELVSYHISE